MRGIPKQDKLVVLGDLNARVGRNETVWVMLLGSMERQWRMKMA